MDSDGFIDFCKYTVAKYYNNFQRSKEEAEIGDVTNWDSVKIVWMSKTIQNNKALCYIPDFPYYYEVTRNGDKHETYIDVYKKEKNMTITDTYYYSFKPFK